ncbi:MAG: hypothetical protein ACR2GD_13775 [Pyrinomonadaceae bacterium]
MILGLVASSNSQNSEKAQPENPKPDAVEEAQKERDKQLLLKVFIGSFLLIFDLILSPGLFSKGENLS